MRDELWLTRIFSVPVSEHLISTSKWALLGLQTRWPIASLALCVPELAAPGPEDCFGSFWSLAGQLIGANHTTSPPFVNDYHTRVTDCFQPLDSRSSLCRVEGTQGSGLPLLTFCINSRGCSRERHQESPLPYLGQEFLGERVWLKGKRPRPPRLDFW